MKWRDEWTERIEGWMVIRDGFSRLALLISFASCAEK